MLGKQLAELLLRKGSLNFGNVRNDAQQKLEAQSPLARSNQVEGNYLLLAVNYEAKLLLCSMWCITTIHFLAMYLAVTKDELNPSFSISTHTNIGRSDDKLLLVSLMLLFTAVLLFSNNHAYFSEENIQESYMGIEENITINICVFSVSQLDKGKMFLRSLDQAEM
ncbi:hypothetical protein T12_8679 [Trichinella patagoniensis]|uniref:Uncharacterized protein n=1 Tax=Trichinella patagoniensis TaxID=990121 RepID=A0A0V0ZZF9_9BILA|nr:hypothetical protein T12_8679 [Trichinella patagoniensis]